MKKTFLFSLGLFFLLYIPLSSYALSSDYLQKSSTISELCKNAFNGEVDFDGGCVFDETKSFDELLGEVTFMSGKKTYSSETLRKLLDTLIVKKYIKLWYTEGSTGMVNAKSRYYKAILTKIGNEFPKKTIQENQKKKDLYGNLYLLLSVMKYENGKEFSQASQNQVHINSTENIKDSQIWKTASENYWAWLWVVWITQADIDRITLAKAKAETEEFMKLTPFEQQAKRFDTVVDWSFPDTSVLTHWLWWLQNRIAELEKWPTIWKFTWQSNDLIYWMIIDDTNAYLWLLLEWWLVNYPQEFVQKTWFFRVYVWPFYWDSNDSWKNWTEYWQNAEKVLNYFWYSIDLDPISPTYLELSYDASKNQAIWQIHMIENKWK